MPQTVLPVYVKDKNGNVGSPITYTSTIYDNEGDPIGGFITQSEVAPEYGTKASYAVGEYCSVNNTVYKCTTAVPDSSVAFNPSDWTNTNAMDEMASVNSSLANKIESYVGMVIHSTTLDTMAKVVAQYGGTTWILHDGYMLRGASSNVTANSAQKDGGSDSASYTPAGTNAGTKLTAAQSGVPAHAHGLNSHKHSVGAHSHGLNSHTHTYSKSNTPTGSTTLTSTQIPSHTHLTVNYAAGTKNALTANNTMGVYAVSGDTDLPYSLRAGSGGANVSKSSATGGGGGHTHTIGTTSTNTGAASGSTANSTAFDSGAATGNTANNTSAAASESHTHTFTGTAATIATLPQYKNVYIWERTA